MRGRTACAQAGRVHTAAQGRYLDSERLVGKTRCVTEDKVCKSWGLCDQDVRRAATEGWDLTGLGRRQHHHWPGAERQVLEQSDVGASIPRFGRRV